MFLICAGHRLSYIDLSSPHASFARPLDLPAMLRHLSIKDFAVVRATELEFGPGMTVVSGETGAGKSLMVDALGFLSGLLNGDDEDPVSYTHLTLPTTERV